MQTGPETRRTLTVREFAQATGAGLTLINKEIREGRIPVVRIGRRVLISRETLDRMLAGETVRGDQAA
jgi:excisionase family DNA binding protein